MMLEDMFDKARVLVVEDDTHLLTGIRDILELDSYRVLTAQNGQDGLTVLNSDPENPPDVIVSDIMMPHMDGFQFLEAVRKQDKWINVPFIFLTAKGEREDRNKGSLLGANHYLTKPFDADDLLIAVASSLNHTRRIKNKFDADMASQKRKILTILNHEFRTPLTLVVAYAEMLKEVDTENKFDDDTKTFLRGVNSGADRLRRLIENFICVVELDTGEAEKTIAWRKRPVHDLIYLVEDARHQIEDSEQRPREFVLDIPADLPIIECDVQYTTIAIRELLDNAAKFSKDNGTIHLSARVEDEMLVIKVSDKGRGIPEHEHENIFRPFYQIDREQFEDQGSGSGLTIVRGVAELHGGSCTVESDLGKGASFTMKIPLKAATKTS
jgi:two-component system, sensor histidine kinase and response regulator